MKKEVIISIAATVAILAIGYAGLVLSGTGRMAFGPKTDTVEIGEQAAKEKVIAFVGENLVSPGTEVTASDAVKEGSYYSLTVTVQGQSVPVYLSLDGKKLFPSVMDTEVVAETADAEPVQEVPKSAKPEVKLFVMSYCPYGTQIEKGILPVLDTLGDTIDFTLEFVPYAMHDKKEIDENLRQYCIRTEAPDKLSSYLGCFLKAGEGTEAACMKSAGIDATKNTACMKSADTEFDVTKNYGDPSTYQGSYPPFNVDLQDATAYGVQGSPTLVINGAVTDTDRDPASLLAAVCAGFEEAPEACGTALPTETPTPGFGEGTAAAGTADAACGS